MIDLRIITVQILLNYTEYLEQNKYFERAFKAYEKGVSIFSPPHVVIIYKTYLSKLTRRFKSSKQERIREAFEAAISKLPLKESKDIYCMYAKYEEDYGSPKKVLAIYDTLCNKLRGSEKFQVFHILL